MHIKKTEEAVKHKIVKWEKNLQKKIGRGKHGLLPKLPPFPLRIKSSSCVKVFCIIELI